METGYEKTFDRDFENRMEIRPISGRRQAGEYMPVGPCISRGNDPVSKGGGRHPAPAQSKQSRPGNVHEFWIVPCRPVFGEI